MARRLAITDGEATNWRDSVSGVPQVSVRVLEPILFITHANDTDNGLTCKIAKFGDDANITRRVTISAEKVELQASLNQFITRAEKCQM